ncbi:ThiF family adenylyltransferase [Rathayibacter oskolensis]|uniref:ThiF family adenylyltransferase n=1 Tax=Rathayibacter oskolensis TaxID=1891671 RepID=UPI0013FD6282|nr:ThiF family adenylyltransferase [Rathayibacter oskolensis]
MLTAIHTHLAQVPPEQGAALLGFGGIVSLALLDDAGSYSGSHWDISSELGQVVPGLESAGAATWMGTVHSHPRGVVNPSATDIRSTRTMLDLNPHISSMIVAIVTEGSPTQVEHLPIGDTHRMSLHVVGVVDGETVVRPLAGEVVPLETAFAEVGLAVVSAVSTREWLRDQEAVLGALPVSVEWRGQTCLAIPVVDAIAVLIPSGYPTAGPVIVEWAADSEIVHPSRWDPSRRPEQQLTAQLRSALGQSASGSRERVGPLVGDLSDRTAVVAGLGSVGSRMAEDLVRAGVGRLRLIDPETIEAPNLARTVYSSDDLGRLKTEALADRLRLIDPAVHIETWSETLGALDIAGSIVDADLVVGATDDMKEQLRLAHFAYRAGVPMVSCALYRGAEAGEIVVAVPAAGTACLACSLGDGASLATLRPPADYGLGGRLTAEPGLGASIQVVASMAGLVALGVLTGPGTKVGDLVADAVVRRQTLAMIATTPRWDFFPELFGDAGHQLAPQSVWIAVERSADCAVCGPVEGRVGPLGASGPALAEMVAHARAELEPSGRSDSPG